MRLAARLNPLMALVFSFPSLADDNVTLYERLTTPSGDEIPYAVYLPNGFEQDRTYPVLVGPGDGTKGGYPGFYWKTDAHSHGWIIIEAQLSSRDTKRNLNSLLDRILSDYNVEGEKFHTACWSANSAGIFRLATDNASRFHSITGMAGNPNAVSPSDIEALRDVKIQFVVAENDRSWRKSAKRSHDAFKAGGIDSALEIVPNEKHAMTTLIGKGFMQRLEKLR